MKILAFIFFPIFFFFGADDTAKETTTAAPESIVCVQDGGSFHCSHFDDGGDCLVVLFESGQVMGLGDDC